MYKVLKNGGIARNSRNYLKCLQQRALATSPSQDVITSADVVIIGGGIAGCNTLYQLTKRGVNAVLLERAKLTSGTTWHTAGLVWSLRPCDLEVKLLQDSRHVYESLEKESGDFAGWINNGGMFISRSQVRTQEYMRLHTLGKALGIPSDVLDPHEAQKLFPLLDPKVFEMALYSPLDGTIDPEMACRALVKVSTHNGGKVYENCPVLDIHYSHNILGNKEVTGVHTDRGFIKTKCVVNCGGAWGPRVARFAGVPSLPIIPFKHAYVLSEALPEVRNCPNVRDHDVNLYLKIQGETCNIGGYENNPIMLDDLPDHQHFHLYELDWDVFGVHMNSAASLCPKLANIGVKSTVCGPESFTPDHKPLLGEDPNVFGLYHNCGYNSAGMMFSAGCGIQMAEWIITGRPHFNMFTFDIRRFSPAQMSRAHWVRESSHEAYAKNYSVVFPNDEKLAGRDTSHDALHQELVEDGAVMQSRGGNTDRRYEELVKGDYSFDFSEHFPIISKEALSCRNGAALFNMSYYGKFYLTGPDAQKTAELAFTADLTKKDDNGFNAPHSLAHLRRIINSQKLRATITDVTKQLCILSVQGPDSQRILQRYTDAGLSNDAFPVGTHRSIHVTKGQDSPGNKTYTCRALRIGWAGELGWELHVPYANAVVMYKALSRAQDLHNAGWRALTALSAEKGYHLWNSDLRADDNPIEAGLGFACRKGGNYIGNEHVTRARISGVTKKYAFFTLEDKVALFGQEAIFRNGQLVGYLRRGDYGYFLDKPIGIGYVKNRGSVVTKDYLENGDYEIEVMGKRYRATVHTRSPFDPTGQRILGNYGCVLENTHDPHAGQNERAGGVE
ncbi:hypothetical protein MSG28_000268 [Choristoneura fumiferana]|uniref:Uncharacterized protein n=1 Tax=Choristoneura fumiferana TaxID=7141 RepID=A0ACC0K0C3_CHOFU|nr:hypothetical protein MSG28_000268 [Choristoneura fumiferana]